AFTSEVFSGSPAAVCFLDRWIDDSILQAIAAENNLSETAYLIRNEEGFDIRWFTPVTEVELCGHATLASAFVLFSCKKWPENCIQFRTRQSGELVVVRQNNLLEMDFPARPARAMRPPTELIEALRVSNKEILGVFSSVEDLLVVLDSEKTIRDVQPDLVALGRLPCRGIIITARGDRSDFVSRFFAPQLGIPEDPATGSSHCVLAPYWAGVLGKNDLHAFQLSKRGGEMFCSHKGERVKISGRAAFYMGGMIII
ncbi:MAG TPA: PhzF family phenazine biosynthesis protein, partial [Methanocellales archaeon]|nr:PhzF family phenazine biosynthesis protein [Methanocellales archaeon]